MSTRHRAHLGTLGIGLMLRPPASRARIARRAFPARVGRILAVLAAFAIATMAAPRAHASRLLVSSALNNSVFRFNGNTGAFTDLFASPSSGLSYPDGMALGPDGNVYIRSSGNVLRFNATTGALIDIFASGGAQSSDPRSFQLRFDPVTGAIVAAPAASGLDGPTGLTFGPDGNLYVSSFGSVMRYNGQTGMPMGTFATGGGLGNATGVAFGPDGNLYVSSYPGGAILEYNGTTGAVIGPFVPAGSGGLSRPIGLTFGPDHNLYVCDYNNNAVLQYNGANGAFMATFTSGGGLNGPTGLTFGLDGNLYVSSYGSSSISQYNGTNGAFIQYFVASGTDGLSGPFGLSFSIEAPTNLVATVRSANEIDLAWTNNSADATGIEIDRKTVTGTGTGTYAPVTPTPLNANTTSFQDLSVSENTTYTYRVRAVWASNSAGLDSAFSNEAGGTTPLNPPSAPANLVATQISGANAGTELALSWQNTSATQTSLMIERKTGNGSYTPVVTLDGTNNRSGYLDTGLTPNTTYTYHIKAVNSAGSSLWSNESSATTLGVPAAPVGLTATAASGTEVDLAWTPSGNNQSGFVIQRNTNGGAYTQLATLPANAVSYADTTAAPNTTYTYQVLATNSVGNSAWSNAASATTPAPPTTPAGLTATPAASGTEIDLIWTNTSTAQTGLVIERKTSGGSYAPLITLGGTATSFADTGLTPHTTYTYHIKATNSVGASGWSGDVTGTTLGPPSAPAGLTATAASGTEVDLAWTNTSTAQTGLVIERKTSGGSYAPLVTLGGTATSFADTGLAPNTTYTYHIEATNSVGASPWSGDVSATTAGLPTPPTALTATLVSPTQVALSWNASTGTVYAYAIWRQDSTGTWSRVGVVGPSITSFTDTTVSANATYNYHVRATNAVGASDWSNTIAVTTAAPPSAPGNLAATTVSASQVTLTWNASTGTVYAYAIWRQDSTGAWSRVGVLPPSMTSFTDTTVSANATYNYHVRATNGVGASDWSNTITVIAVTPVPPAVPSAPTALTTGSVTSTQVPLTWGASTGTVYAYAVWRQDSTGAWSRVGVVPPSMTSFTDTTVSANATYNYHVRATNGVGASDWSNTITVIAVTPAPPAVPSAPTALTTGSVTSTQVPLTWGASTGTVYAYAIWRQDSTGTWTRVGVLPPSITSFTDTTVSANATYNYHVRATNGVGASDWSNTITVIAVTPAPPAVPSAPTALTAGPVSSTQVALTWSASTGTVYAYAIWRQDSTGAWSRVGVVPPSMTSFTDTTVSANATYNYHVRATNGVGASDWSNTVTATATGP